MEDQDISETFSPFSFDTSDYAFDVEYDWMYVDEAFSWNSEDPLSPVSAASSNKKQKKDPNEPSHDIVLPALVMSHIMHYVDLDTLYSMVFCCKDMKELLQVRTVVRAVMAKGGFARTSFDRLHKLLERGSIWPVSAVRLLQLAKGRQCELMCGESLRYVNKDYGLFVCRSCLSQHQVLCEKEGKMYDRHTSAFNCVLDWNKVAAVKKGWRRVPDEQWTTELSRAKSVGLRVNHEEDGSELMVYDHRHIMWNKPMTGVDGKPIGPVLRPIDILHMISSVINCKDRTKWYGIILTYYSDTMKKMAENTNDTRSYLACYATAVRMGDARKRLADMQAVTANARHIALKTKLAVDFVEKIKTKMDNPVKAEKLLQYSVNRDFGSKKRSLHDCMYKPRGPIVFQTDWINTILDGYILRTTTVKTSDIEEIVQRMIDHEKRSKQLRDELLAMRG